MAPLVAEWTNSARGGTAPWMRGGPPAPAGGRSIIRGPSAGSAVDETTSSPGRERTAAVGTRASERRTGGPSPTTAYALMFFVALIVDDAYWWEQIGGNLAITVNKEVPPGRLANAARARPPRRGAARIVGPGPLERGPDDRGRGLARHRAPHLVSDPTRVWAARDE